MPMDVMERLAPALELLRSNAPEADRTGVLPPENIEALRAAGAFAWSRAKKLDGDELSAVEKLAAFEAVAAADLSTIWIFASYDSHVWELSARLLADSFPEAESVLRGEEACCGTAAPLTGSLLEGEEIIVNGRFNFTTGWRQARWLRGMVAVPGPAPELPAPADPPRFHLRVVMVPLGLPEVRPEETWDSVGLRATQTDTIVVEGLRLPRSHSAPFVTDAERRSPEYPVPSSYYREPGWTWANARGGAELLACAREVFRVAHDYTGGGKALFTGQPAARFPAVRYAMSDAYIGIATGLAAFEGLAVASDARVAAGQRWEMDDEMAVWACGMMGGQAALRAVDQMMLALGGTGTQKALPFERYFRDIRTGALHLGIHPSLVKDRVAGHLFPQFAR